MSGGTTSDSAPDPSKAAAFYLDSIRERASTANKIAILWSVSLFFIWTLGLEQADSNLARLATTADTLTGARRAHADFRRRSDPLGEARTEQFERMATKLQGLKEDSVSRAKLAEGIPFNVPGFDEKIPTVYAPLLWNALALGLISYLFFVRSALTSLLLRAGRTSQSIAPGLSHEAETRLGEAPSWLAPFPGRFRPPQPSFTVRDVYGRSLSDPGSSLTILVFGLILLVVQIRVAFIEAKAAAAIGGPFQVWALPSISYALVTASAALLWLWFRPGRFRDAPTVAAISVEVDRRAALLALSTVIVALLVSPVVRYVRTIKASARPKQPRFRQRVARPAYTSRRPPNAFYTNSKSQIVHFVRADGTVAHTTWLRDDNLVPASVVTLSLQSPRPRVHLASAAESFELAALDRVAAKRYDEACRLLLDGIRHDLLLKLATDQRLAMRLYDLLAGLTIRFSKRQYLAELNQLVAESRVDPGDSAALWSSPRAKSQRDLTSRLARWGDSNGSWKARWTSKSKRWSYTYRGTTMGLVF